MHRVTSKLADFTEETIRDMIVKLILLLTFTALIAWVIIPSENVEIERLSGKYQYTFESQDNLSSIQYLTFYPNESWTYSVEGHSDSGKYKRNGKNVTITGRRFIHEDFRILRNKSLRDSVGRIWKKKDLNRG